MKSSLPGRDRRGCRRGLHRLQPPHKVCEWIRFGKLRALALQHKYMTPKCYLIDWLSSDEHNATLRKSHRHIDRLWELQKWSDGQ